MNIIRHQPNEVLYAKEAKAEIDRHVQWLERQIKDLTVHNEKLAADLHESTRQRKSNQAMYNAVFMQMREAFCIPDRVPFSEFGCYIQDVMRKRQEPAPDKAPALECRTYLVEPDRL